LAARRVKTIAFWLGWAWLCVEIWWIFLRSVHSPMDSFSTILKTMVATGGPVVLVASLLLAVQKEKVAGGLAWLGAAAAAIAFSIGSGASLGSYFTGFLMVVAPQAVVGTLLIRAGVERERRESAVQRRSLR